MAHHLFNGSTLPSDSSSLALNLPTFTTPQRPQAAQAQPQPQQHGVMFTGISTPGSGAEDDKPKRKRNRITLSCIPCHRRKQKCDRGQPCSRCIRRGVPHECVMEPQDGSGQAGGHRKRLRTSEEFTTSQAQAVEQLFGHLQQNPPSPNALQRMLSSLPRPASEGGASRDQDTEHAAQALEQLSQRPADGADGAGGLALFEAAGLVNVLNKIQNAQMQSAAASPSTSASATSPAPAPAPAPGAVPAATLQHLFSSLGSEPHVPPKSTCDALVDAFFSPNGLNRLYGVFHRPTFDEAYNAYWNGQQTKENTALILIIVALGLQVLPETHHHLVDPQLSMLRSTFFTFARTALHEDEAANHTPTVLRVQIGLLNAIYLENENRPSDSFLSIGNVVRLAQSIHLHRDPQRVSPSSPVAEAEARRRAWYALFTLDRLRGGEFEKPYGIDERHVDVRLPRDVDDAAIGDEGQEEREGESEYSYHLRQIALARLAGTIFDYTIKPPAYRAVLTLEQELLALEERVSRSRSPEEQEHDLPHAVMRAQLKVLRARLHKPYLGLDDDRYGQSRDACLKASGDALRVMEEACAWMPKSQKRLYTVALLVFEPALILASSILMNPPGTELAELEKLIELSRQLLTTLADDGENATARQGLSALDTLTERRSVLQSLGITPGVATGADAAADVTGSSGPAIDPALAGVGEKEGAGAAQEDGDDSWMDEVPASEEGVASAAAGAGTGMGVGEVVGR